MLFDTHVHLNDPCFDPDRTELMTALPQKGLTLAMNAGCSLESSRDALNMAAPYDWLYCSVGSHPDSCDEVCDEVLEEYRKLCKLNPKVKAIGEIGLDYHYDTHPREYQRFWFIQQLRLAEETGLPVVIHSREASQDTFDIIERSKVRRGSIHCYSGSAEMAKDYVKMGFHIGVGGVVTFPNAKKLVEVVEAIPIESILIETDCPYLAPAPNRGKRNDSSNLKYVVEKIAEIKGLTPEKVAEITKKNAEDLFLK